ncbi:type III-D CRISPR-associated protein Csx19 [Velocimicrobium porci]|uniref:Uncharacterized protein n=1 Tax=Velocimicrobium porci TaxID=2606634 RepID=A0A6L5XZJ5_9FIRM|nr:CRISPR-associated protein Csx19 [Velocimicrobium porci]MSS63638.1 hypothetical protein [Velocimicrobium porci]
MPELKELEQITVEIKKDIKPEQCICEVRNKFNKEAYLYAVLEYGVALGKYKNELYIGLYDVGKQHSQKLPMEYVREFRVFDEEKELRFVRMKDNFIMRYCLDVDRFSNRKKEIIYYFDEKQKIFGSVKNELALIKHDKEKWSILESKRGSKIVVPFQLKREEELGLMIRYYVQFPDATDEVGLVNVVDERLLKICDWEENVNE